MPNHITLQHYRPLPNPGPQLANQRFATPGTSLVITSTRDRGMESCRIGYPQRVEQIWQPAWLPEPLGAFWPFGHTTVSDGNGLLFIGRASVQPEYIGGQIRAITAAGYWEALNDHYFSSSDSAFTTSGEIIKSVILQTIGYVSISGEYWTDPGVSHQPNEFDAMRGGAIVQSLLNEGNGTPVDLQFWPTMNGRIVAELRDRVGPDTVDYMVSWPQNKDLVNLTYDPQQLYGHIRVRYTPKGGSETATSWSPSSDDTAFSDVWGFDRYLEVSGGQLSANGATQLRDTTYAIHSEPQWFGTIRCSAKFPLRDLNGRPVTLAHVRAGRWMRVEGLTKRDGVTPNHLQIQQVVYDAVADTLELTVAQGITRHTLQERIVESDAALRTGRNPVTAAKAT